MSNNKKRRRGPTPDPTNRRNIRVCVHLSSAEHQALLGKVGSPKLLPGFMRDVTLETKRCARVVVPELNAKAYAGLARAAANLNQIARKLNSNEACSAEAIRTALDDFRLALIDAKERRA